MTKKDARSKELKNKNKKLAIILGVIASGFYLFFFVLQHLS
jgi:uncharacterized membrane protein (DUF485 family)|tara:strand:+ start:508 stop:630 length:123 start_codon:yes stop_codon:yes gene_type:complete